tara:strand:+ start:78 stop:386 length:309 start_codon:yes stop_codon:yes gene_type:complete
MIEHRPWGTYEVLLDKPDHKVKEIYLKPKHRFSLQYHEHREEHWVVVKVVVPSLKMMEKQLYHQVNMHIYQKELSIVYVVEKKVLPLLKFKRVYVKRMILLE